MELLRARRWFQKEFKVESYWFCLTCCSCWKAPWCVSPTDTKFSLYRLTHVRKIFPFTDFCLFAWSQTGSTQVWWSIWAIENVNITRWLSPFHEDLLSPVEYQMQLMKGSKAECPVSGEETNLGRDLQAFTMWCISNHVPKWGSRWWWEFRGHHELHQEVSLELDFEGWVGFFFLIVVFLLYNIALVSAVQQHESLYVDVYPLPLVPPSLPAPIPLI